MDNEKETSFENLNFYIDDEFSHSDKLKIQDILKNNKELDKTVKELQRNDELIYKLYNNIPEPEHAHSVVAKKSKKTFFIIISVVLIILIFYIGWYTW